MNETKNIPRRRDFYLSLIDHCDPKDPYITLFEVSPAGYNELIGIKEGRDVVHYMNNIITDFGGKRIS